MVAEWKNLLLRCLSPVFAAKLATFYFTKLTAKVKRRVFPPTVFYPSPIRQASKAFLGRKVDAGEITVTPSRLLDNGKDRLRLATGYYEFSGSPAWETVFDDMEQTASLHRWNWLLMRLDEERGPNIELWGLRLMRDWNLWMMKTRAGLPWATYTTGERICNAVLFLACTDPSVGALPKLPDEIAQALAVMANHVARHLEYRDPESTGNHVINNARALCFAGQALQIPSATELAAAILRNDLSRLVSADGFLREGSSHYHFLITRWLLEMLWICRITQGHKIPAIVEPLAARMVQRCWFFLVGQPLSGRWVMPLIGDVSPDFPWEWLIDLPWSGEAQRLYAHPSFSSPISRRGWAALFEDGQETTDAEEIHQRAGGTDIPTFQPFPESGWYRLDWGTLTLFWHVEPGGVPSFPSHGHCDTGSFSLYWKGVEVLADPGRLNYKENDRWGVYGISPNAHNNVLIDGHAPFIYKHSGRYPDFYRAGNMQVVWDIQRESFALSLRHNGFSRLYRYPIIFERVFHVLSDRLVIEDRFSGECRHTISTCFQWAPGVSVVETERPGVFKIEARAAQFRAKFCTEPMDAETQSADFRCRVLRGEGSEPSGWYFPAYGEKVEACTLLLNRQATLPDAWRHTLRWSNQPA